jgi:uncharacterized membrane protein YccF (DUF307 family)
MASLVRRIGSQSHADTHYTITHKLSQVWEQPAACCATVVNSLWEQLLLCWWFVDAARCCLCMVVARLGLPVGIKNTVSPVAFLSSFGNDKLLHEIADQQATPLRYFAAVQLPNSAMCGALSLLT